MDYSLAKELKDAGFPQKKMEITGIYVGVCKHGFFGASEGRESCECGEQETVHLPILSELIEACGEEFALLLRGAEGRWFAQGFDNKSGTNFLGSTPEEAVARLWLARNRPPKPL